ncbi:hypothetical protein FQN50_008081 [Emmonsiellopsis sp. PD_5]|nr:hypothetical protein FQN50_008081 [Emmonsiellopsis sp. PD_5]
MDVVGLTLPNPCLENIPQLQPHPYASSIASSASSSSSSVFSLDSSQSSISSSTTGPDVIWEQPESSSDSQTGGRYLSSNESNFHCSRSRRGCASKVADAAVAPELRQNPRRTYRNALSTSCPQPRPSLVRQCERKHTFVDNLVGKSDKSPSLSCSLYLISYSVFGLEDSASQIVETIWPLSVVEHPPTSKGVLPLRTFIQETLRRSRTSYSTLQVALYYLIMIKAFVPKHDFTMEQPSDLPCMRAMQCGRRMFLSALILASKYLQDRNYSARAWSKISGLNTVEINQNELSFLQAVGWKLHISERVFQRWTDIVLKYTPNAGGPSNGEGLCWRDVIPLLTPELDTIDLDSDSYRGVPDLVMSGTSSGSQTPMSDKLPSLSPPPNDQTPKCPRKAFATFEPASYSAVPPLPTIYPLPTPQMTPESSAVNTPAASVGAFPGRKFSICAAMSQARSMCRQRTTFETRPTSTDDKAFPMDCYRPPLVRRSSLARSASSVSSPESMVSDVPSLTSSRSSRSSRSSSISSVASGACAPAQPRLAMRATRRCAAQAFSYTKILTHPERNLTIVPPIDEEYSGEYASPLPLSAEGNVPDLTGFSIGTPADLAHEAAQGLCALSGAMPRSYYTSATPTATSTPSPTRSKRKRGHSNADELSLQKNVRELMTFDNSYSGAQQIEDDSIAVVPDNQIADSFLIHSQPKAPQPLSPRSLRAATLRLPMPLAMARSSGSSMKRKCCAKEAAKYLWAMGNAPEGRSSGMGTPEIVE